jgi:predicted ATPase
MLKSNFYVITGGPGAGKTTLLEALRSQGLKIVPEDARRIIKDQVSIDGDGLPWRNVSMYTGLMLDASISSYQSHADKTGEIHLFDRGILDTLCYAEMTDQGISSEMNTAALEHRYNNTVFMLPPWKEIYQTDSERLQTWEEAVHTFLAMKEIYIRYGYTVVEVPKGSVEYRTAFILDQLKSLNP